MLLIKNFLEATKDVGWFQNLMKAEAGFWKHLWNTPSWWTANFKSPPIKDQALKALDYTMGSIPSITQKGAIKGTEYTLFVANKTKAALTTTVTAPVKAPIAGFKALREGTFSVLKLAKQLLTLGMLR